MKRQRGTQGERDPGEGGKAWEQDCQQRGLEGGNQPVGMRPRCLQAANGQLLKGQGTARELETGV